MNSLANCTVLTTEHRLAGTEAVSSTLRPSAAVFRSRGWGPCDGWWTPSCGWRT